MIEPRLADRLSKCLALLASPHVGERAAAALKVADLVRRAGLRWDDILADGMTPRWREPATLDEAVGVCFAHFDLLTHWEKTFIRNIKGKQRLSERQACALDRILARLRGFHG